MICTISKVDLRHWQPRMTDRRAVQYHRSPLCLCHACRERHPLGHSCFARSCWPNRKGLFLCCLIASRPPCRCINIFQWGRNFSSGLGNTSSLAKHLTDLERSPDPFDVQHWFIRLRRSGQIRCMEPPAKLLGGSSQKCCCSRTRLRHVKICLKILCHLCCIRCWHCCQSSLGLGTCNSHSNSVRGTTS